MKSIRSFADLAVLRASADLRGTLPAGRNVIFPLSYGDQHYADAMADAEQRVPGNQFLLLRAFTDSTVHSEIAFLHTANPIGRSMPRIDAELSKPGSGEGLDEVRCSIDGQYGRASILRRTRFELDKVAPEEP